MTRAALAASPEEASDALSAAAQRRAELQRDLEDSPCECPRDLALELEAVEAQFLALAIGLLGQVRDGLVELHRVRSATRGYRPSVGSLPAFVSRSI